MGLKADAYVDGSYNVNTNTYGSGVILIINDTKEFTHSIPGNDIGMAAMRNVAGEIIAALWAVQTCRGINNLDSLTIHYDYEGIEKWVTGAWRAKNPYTQQYKVAMSGVPFKLDFVHVKAHSGDYYNERVDLLAKKAAGII